MANRFISILIPVLLIIIDPVDLKAQKKSGNSQGELFLQPIEVKRTKVIKKNALLVSHHQTGLMQTKDEESPWYNASFFIQGSIVKDTSGGIIQQVALFETVDDDGDLSWGTIWQEMDGCYTIELKMGTGKWKNIQGEGTMKELDLLRVDGHQRFRWEFNWVVDFADRMNPESTAFDGMYKYHDVGLSFHGPHIEDFRKELSNGITLLVSNQSGVLLSDDRGAFSPRNLATCYDRGTTYIRNGNVQGDVMLLEDTDPDGDIVWLYHEWWYNKGPGKYEFIGGIGKWKGITGVGITRGMLKKRSDDHFMLRSEMFWNMKQKP